MGRKYAPQSKEKMNKYLRETTLEDIKFLAPNLRKADYEECLAATGREPYGVLAEGLDWGDQNYTMVAPTGIPVGLLGVGKSIIEDAGSIWLCATDDIVKYQMTFLRHSKQVLKELQQDYLALHNYVDARNSLHIKWLKWMGFTFINRFERFGVEQRPFYEFVRI